LLLLLLQIESVPVTGDSAVDFTWLFVKMLMLLGIVSIIAILVLKFAVPHLGVMKRFQKGKYFQIMGRHVLEPRKSLYLVKMAKRYMVIGVADHGINLITELTEEEAKGHKGAAKH